MEEYLDLDRRLLKRSAKVHAGYAHLVEQESSSDSRSGEMGMLMASSLASAAVYGALIGENYPSSLYQTNLFSKAADEYQKLGRPFYIVLAICADYKRLTLDYVDREIPDDLAFDSRSTDPEKLLYDLLVTMDRVSSKTHDEYQYAIAAKAQRLLPRLLDRGNDLRLLPVGRLQLPLRLYLLLGRGVFQAVSREDLELQEVRAALVEYLQRVDEVVGEAMSDRFHWRRLRSGVLPLEPEALATCVTVDKLSHKLTGRRVRSLLEDTDLTPRQKVAAQTATSMIEYE